MLGDAPAQCLAQLGGLVARRSLRQRGQACRVGFARNDGIPTYQPKYVLIFKETPTKGKFVAVGSSSDVQGYIGPNTRR